MFCSSFRRILPDGFEQIQLYAGLSGPLFFVFLTQAGHFVTTALLRVTKYTLVHVSMRLGDPFDTTENVSLFFVCVNIYYNPQIALSPTSSFSARFNRNCVKNHPKPWICPVCYFKKSEYIPVLACIYFLTTIVC